MVYDHHRKAGNQGDCVKHPALIAALDGVLKPGNAEPFHYLDVFAGHAWHPLLDEKALEWKKGIRALFKPLWEAQRLNEHVRLWRDWYLAHRPSMVRSWYPGSSVIAADVCCKHNRHIRMTLFDISDEARGDLRQFFQPLQPTELTEDDWCIIGRSFGPTKVKKDAIREADFVLIDPPNFGGVGMPDWRPHFQHMLIERKKTPTVIWLPPSGADHIWKSLEDYVKIPGESPITNKRNPQFFERLAECRYIGYHWTAVRWAKGGSNAACILIYNCAHDAIRPAVECVAKIAAWGNGPSSFESVKHSEDVQSSNSSV